MKLKFIKTEITLSSTDIYYSNIICRRLLWHLSKGLCLLFFLSILFAFKKQETPASFPYGPAIEKIAIIENPHERAIEWLIYVSKTSNYQPNKIVQLIDIGETLWGNDFPEKQVIRLLTKAEVDKVNGNFQHTPSNVLHAIESLEAKPNKSILENKLLVMAYIAFAKYSKYTREKEGIAFGYKGLELANQINFPTGKILAHNQIGLLIGYLKNDYFTAMEHFLAAKALLPLLPPSAYELSNGFILGNIAKVWSDLGDIEKSIDYKLQVIANEKNHHNIELLLGTNNNLGTNYYELKEYELAEKHLHTTLALMDEHKVYTNKGIPLLRLGLIQLEKGNINKAATFADAIDFWLINHKYVGNYLISFYEFKSKIAKKLGDYEQAIYWLEKASKEQVAANKIVESNNLVKLEKENKFKEIKQELLLLEKEKALNQATINFQHLLLLTIALIAILSIWFSFSSYYKTKAVKEAYDYILGKNNAFVATANNKPKIAINPNPKNIDNALKEKILHALEIEKAFLAPNLTLKKFADQLASNTSYVSQTINEGCGKNFNSLINEYRVNEVLHFFQENQHQIYTIETLYQKAGFNSKSSFQKAFKKTTGVTASYYLEQLK